VTATEPLDDAQRYRILRDKDAAWDGHFVFAVKTTGIFCKPSCAARTPRPHNVEYFDRPAAAIVAGYRACLRCRPGESVPLHPRWLEEVCRFIQDAESEPRLQELAQLAGCSASTFQRAFKAALGVSPKEYALALRHERLRQQLQAGDSVTRAAYSAGYGSSGRLYAESSAVLGMEPRRYQAAGKGETIKYSTAASPFGRLLVARTERGVCAVSLGDDDERLVSDLVRLFEAAQVVESPELGGDLAAVFEMWQTGADNSGLPLDIRGTAFQHRVWQALRRIPAGETRTYKEVAIEVGAPDAVRAVGSACAANRLALVVPCHRVLRSDGGLGGFRWGLPTKRRLLDSERGAADQAEPVGEAPGSE
jgi:AraC family transcriptional regulator, regulatory protein of adaptative response / methylated-DNA-[protein]-cysteine methyltransferase